MTIGLQKLDLTKSQRVSMPEHRPRLIADVGIPESLLEDIALKSLYLSGPFTVLDLAEETHVGFEVAEQILGRLRTKLLCEVAGMVGNVPRIAISSHGRSRALELLSQNQYSGSVPVSLESYVAQVRRQAVRGLDVGPPEVERAFAHMVFDDELLSQFGMALNSGAAVFLYGPPGVGKTAVAETLSRVLAQDKVWIPYAVEAGGQIITVYDPVIHGPAEAPLSGDYDRRWVRCSRPTVIVGGELTADMLDLQFNPVSKYYEGPAQMKANNGVLIIDDFGRQRIAPEDLLNRWVVPLDRKIEFLSLIGGRKIEIPFELLVVFATNKDPGSILEPAFMRRIQTKIRIGPASDEQFCEIFRRVAAEYGCTIEQEVIDELMMVIRDKLGQELRSCYPRDLVDQIRWKARYEGKALSLDRVSLMRAVKTYFLQGG